MPGARYSCRGAEYPSAAFLRFRQRPVDRLQSFRGQERIRLREMRAAEEAAVGRKRRWMRGPEHQMPRGVDECRFLLRVASPQHEHDGIRLGVDLADDLVGEPLPATVAMRGR